MYGNQYIQVFANKAYFSKVYPIDYKKKSRYALKLLCKYFGLPEKLNFHVSKEQTYKGNTFMKEINR